MVADLTTADSRHPMNDHDFASEAIDSREHILRWWAFMVQIDTAPQRQQAILAIARAHGLGLKTISRLYYGNGRRKEGWKKHRDWRVLADRRAWPDPNDANLPFRFITWVKEIHEKHQRDTSFRQTYRCVLAALELWERNPASQEHVIPGFEDPPARNTFSGVPCGWSPSNLARRCQSTRYEKALRRQGPKRASEFLPSVRTTRLGLEFFELVYCDDQEHDAWINLTGINRDATRPQSFDAVEGLSGSNFEQGLKPQIWDGEVRRELTGLDFFWFLMWILTRHGYNAHTGTTFVIEHGKANPDKSGFVEERLLKATGGMVRFDKSGLFRAPAFKAMLFEGQSSGNFRFKAPIESWFNLFRNYSGALPAPTGRTYQLGPEENATAEVPRSLLGENRFLQGLIDKVSASHFLRLKRPVLEWEDYRHFHRLIMRAIDQRTDHALEGYRKLGFTKAFMRLGHDQPWIDEFTYQKIPAQTRLLYDAIVRQPGNQDIRLMSPFEVFSLHRPQLTKLPLHIVPMVAPKRAWQKIVVSNSLELTINDQWLDSDPLYYHGKVRTPRGHEIVLQRGKTYLRLLNIFDPDRLWIAEADGTSTGAVLGVANRVQVGCKSVADQEKLLRQMGDKAHMKSIESIEVHARMASEAARRVAAREFNRNLIGGRPASIEEKAQSRIDRHRLHEIQKTLTAEDLAAAIGGTPAVASEDEISSEEVSALFASEPNDSNNEGETEW